MVYSQAGLMIATIHQRAKHPPYLSSASAVKTLALAANQSLHNGDDA
jgi:hypothetical protein